MGRKVVVRWECDRCGMVDYTWDFDTPPDRWKFQIVTDKIGNRETLCPSCYAEEEAEREKIKMRGGDFLFGSK